MNISDRLREERERLGLNQVDFGAVGGVKKLAQINYEKGERHPDSAYLAAIAAAGADVLYVLTGQRSPSMPAADPAEQVLLDSYRRCSAQARQNLIQTAVLLSAGLPSKPKAAPRGSAGGQHNVGDNAIQIGSVSGEARVKNR